MTFRGLFHRVKLIANGRAGVVWYDLLNRLRGIDLSSASVDDLGLSPERSYWYSDSGGPDLALALEFFDVATTERVLDVGCGKGGVILAMKKFGISLVDGLEISEHLVRVAKENCARSGWANVRVICSDAATYSDLDDYSLFHLYNPFPCQVFRDFLKQVENSVRRTPRRIRLMYKNPTCAEMIMETGMYSVVSSTVIGGFRYVLYERRFV